MKKNILTVTSTSRQVVDRIVANGKAHGQHVELVAYPARASEGHLIADPMFASQRETYAVRLVLVDTKREIVRAILPSWY